MIRISQATWRMAIVMSKVVFLLKRWGVRACGGGLDVGVGGDSDVMDGFSFCSTPGPRGLALVSMRG